MGEDECRSGHASVERVKTQEMDRDGVNQLPVTKDQHVIGMLSREDVITFLRTIQELGTQPV
jgi:CBS domain-containing protein